jgi:excisionase family DNA binding protein
MVTIYALSEPENGAVRYIGQTTLPIARLTSYLLESEPDASVTSRWMHGLAARGALPGILTLEQVEPSEAAAAEARWIQHYRAQGADLLNAREKGIPDDQTPKADEWLNASLAARQKGVSREAVGRAIREGRLKAHRVGKGYLIHRDAVEAWKPAAGWPKGRSRKKKG